MPHVKLLTRKTNKMQSLIVAKFQTIENYLNRIKSTVEPAPEKILNDFDVQDIYVLNLQRAIKSIIDVASILIAELALTHPKTMKEHFVILHNANIISAKCSKSMVAMVGFRNVAVHNYKTINPEILLSVYRNNLSDIELFQTEVANHIRT